MTRGEMLLHVATHAAGHRGQVALLLQKNGIQPFPDRITDFLKAEDAVQIEPRSRHDEAHEEPLSLERFPLHLGLGARAVAQPEFTGMEWYAAYAERNAADGTEGRLVSLYSFSENWTSWERHPVGDEAVICTAGEITLIQEVAGRTAQDHAARGRIRDQSARRLAHGGHRRPRHGAVHHRRRGTEHRPR